MNRMIYRRLVALVVMLAVPLAVQAKECYDVFVPYCNFTTNGQFNSTGSDWGPSPHNASFPYVYRCNSWTYVAEIQGTEYIEQTFYVDDSFSSFNLAFEAYLQNDTNNWYDALKVTVTNTSTNQSEFRTWRGSSYSSTCSVNSWDLSGNYSNSWVKVKFEAMQYTLGTWEVDNVRFTAIY